MPTKTKRREKTKNKYVFAGDSVIHRHGLFALVDIPKKTDIVEYEGPRVSKREGRLQAEDGNVYIFSLDRKQDINGNVGWNLARHANHSCHPNAVSIGIKDSIWLRALRDIAKGEEVTFDYCYSLKDYKDDPCRCGHPQCVGFIVHQKYKKKLAAGVC